MIEAAIVHHLRPPGDSMNTRIVDELKKELVARDFAPDGNAPNGSMQLDDTYLLGVELAELFDAMVARREKVFRSVDVVGADVARRSYEDVVLAIEAIKVVVSRLTLP